VTYGSDRVHEPHQATQPPGRLSEQRESGGVAQRERLPDAEMDDEAGHPGAIGVFGHGGAEDEVKVHPGQAGQLRNHHDGSEDRGGGKPEQCPSGLVHRRQRCASWLAFAPSAPSTWANEWWKLATPCSSRVLPTSVMSMPALASCSIASAAPGTPVSMVRSTRP
jgi:hypothetical protein